VWRAESALGRLEQFDREIRDHLKVARVSGDNRISEMQSGCSDQQVLEWNRIRRRFQRRFGLNFVFTPAPLS